MLFQYTDCSYDEKQFSDGSRHIFSQFDYYYDNRSLQAQVPVETVRKRKRALCFVPCRGSATVEAALILPIFLCAVCTLIMIGQMLLVEGEVRHCLVQTASVCAKQESAADILGVRTGLPGAYLEPAAAFYSIFQANDLCKSCIQGGSHGIILSMDKSDGEDRLKITARYALKIPIPFFRGLYTAREISAVKRLYTGYIPHKGEGNQKDKVVYLAENGAVYHTSMSCSHISLRISGSSLTRTMLEGRGIRACERCIRSGSIPSAYYITAEGDCYHSSLTCSGLKRTVRAVRLSEVSGMRQCARCAAKSAG